MTDIYQETNSRTVLILPHGSTALSETALGSRFCDLQEQYRVRFGHPSAFDFHAQPWTRTTGGKSNILFAPLPEDSGLDSSVWRAIYQANNQQVTREAERLVSIAQELIATLKQVGLDVARLPPLRGFNVDDGSILFEWISDNYRIGFSIEPDPKDSGWYLVSNENLGDVSASGHTSAIHSEKLVMWLLFFALANS